MKGTKLSLSSTWLVGERIGQGGFGQVYELEGGPQPAVAKLIPKAPGAERELLFAALEGVRNIVPIIDSGEHHDSWVLVMPRAEESLEDRLEECGGVLEFDEALAVLIDVATALEDLDGRVIHRDIKPANILLLDGTWCLADFGISRYAEATTATNTHKWTGSAPYFAPERWRSERATGAADVYTLGVVGFEMLTGRTPFPGPGAEDYREQHLHDDPPALNGVPSALATVLDECLFKSAAARPSPANLLKRLTRQKEKPPRGGLAALQAANQAQVRRQAEADKERSKAALAAEIHAERAQAAKRLYEKIGDSLRDAIIDVAPAVELTPDRSRRLGHSSGWTMKLGAASLIFSSCTTGSATWGEWAAPSFTVDAWGGLAVQFPRSHYDYEGRAHSLWFGDIQQQGEFAWYETAFMISPMMQLRPTVVPFAKDPGEDSAKAVWNGVAEFQVAWPFTRLEPENLDEFVDRWAEWFAAASSGKLTHPSSIPERSPNGSWRRS